MYLTVVPPGLDLVGVLFPGPAGPGYPLPAPLGPCPARMGLSMRLFKENWG